MDLHQDLHESFHVVPDSVGDPLGGWAWGCLVTAEHHRSADHSWSKGRFDVYMPKLLGAPQTGGG